MRTKEAITPHEVHDDFDTQLQCEDVYAGEDTDEVSLKRGEYTTTTKEWYEYSFEVLPPFWIPGGGFAVSEPLDHDRATGIPIYFGYLELAGKHYQAIGTRTEIEGIFSKIRNEAKTPLGQRVICGKCLKHLATDGSKGDYRLTENLQPICAECCAASQEGAA